MKHFFAATLAIVFAVALFGALPAAAQTSATFTVNSADDVDDGTCDAAHCSLREAINASNQNDPGVTENTIVFNIAGSGLHTIQPTTPLPPLTEDVTIDAATQPGYAAGAPVIELNGDNVVTSVLEDKVGIRVFVPFPNQYRSAIRGFVINGFEYAGVVIDGTLYYKVESSFIGTNAAGTQAVPNGYGIIIRNTYESTIGGTTIAQRNIISGNAADGINIRDENVPFRNFGYNRIWGNYIGVNAAGTAALGNGGNGITVEWSDGTEISHGPFDNGSQSIISGNGLNGIVLKGLSFWRAFIYENAIGTDATGTILLGNGLNGVLVEGASVAQLGDSFSPGNIIAGNGQNGIRIVDAASTQNIISGNSIFENGGLGIELGSDGVTANDSGDADNGPSTLQNFPVMTKAITSLTLGSNAEGTLNSRPNTPYVIHFFSNASCDPSGYGEGKILEGSKFVTTDANGNAYFLWHGNSGHAPGVFFTAMASKSDMPTPGYGSHDMSEFSACIQTLDAAHNGFTFTVNTTADTNDGVCDSANCSFREALTHAQDSMGPDTILFNIPGTGIHTISLNYLDLPAISGGTTIDGTSQPGYAGKPLIAITGFSASACLLHIAGDSNVIRGLVMQSDCRVWIQGNDNVIQGNYFGTDANGLRATWVQGGGLGAVGNRNIIGGVLPAERNVIAANNSGFTVSGNNNRIQGNYVGVDATGKSVLGDALSGITITGNDNLIGGTTPGAGNIVAGAKFAGVRIISGFRNAVLGNRIFANGQNGIDLDNSVYSKYLNDPGDTDEGTNHYQNYPELELALKTGSDFSIKGTLNSAPDTAFRLEFFANPACDLWGYGEGEIYLGFANVQTGVDGNAAFESVLPVTVPQGYAITATATDPDNNTSELSSCITFMSPGAAPIQNYYRTRFVPLTWTSISWATGYYVQVDSDPDFDNDVYPFSYFTFYVLNANAISVTLNLPNNDHVYYWRVGAMRPDGGLQWSATQTFMVDLS